MNIFSKEMGVDNGSWVAQETRKRIKGDNDVIYWYKTKYMDKSKINLSVCHERKSIPPQCSKHLQHVASASNLLVHVVMSKLAPPPIEECKIIGQILDFNIDEANHCNLQSWHYSMNYGPTLSQFSSLACVHVSLTAQHCQLTWPSYDQSK